MPALYMIGAKAVTKNLWKTCKIPLTTLLTPKMMGLKNIIRMSKTVSIFFAAENPGAIKSTNKGAMIIQTKQTIFKESDVYHQLQDERGGID